MLVMRNGLLEEMDQSVLLVKQTNSSTTSNIDSAQNTVKITHTLKIEFVIVMMDSNGMVLNVLQKFKVTLVQMQVNSSSNLKDKNGVLQNA